MSRGSAGKLVQAICGAFLLISVALKVETMTSEGGAGATQLLSPRTQLLGLEIEAMVGIWLLSGYARQSAWLAGAVLFATLAGVSLYLAWIGQESCGCFGKVVVSPWVSLVADLVCVTALVWSRPKVESVKGNLLSVLCALLVLGVLSVANYSVTVRREIARLRGDALFIGETELDAGMKRKDELDSIPVQIENLTTSDIRLIGGVASCACVVTDDLPLVIPAKGKATANVKVKFIGSVGRFRHTFTWYTDAPSQLKFSGGITGRVTTD
jgi:hypothetical protein